MHCPPFIKTGFKVIFGRGFLILFLFIFSFLHGKFVHAQQGEIRISGVVIDYITSEPIPGVNVLISERKMNMGYKDPEEFLLESYITDSLGRYEPVSFRKRIFYEVSFSKNGYLSKQICFNLLSAPANFSNEPVIEFGTDIYLLPLHSDLNYDPVRGKDYGLFFYNSKLNEWMWDEDVTSAFHAAEDSVIKDLDSLKKLIPEKLYAGFEPVEATMHPSEKIWKPVSYPIVIEWLLTHFYVIVILFAFIMYLLIRRYKKRRNKKFN
jgi:hypothetical protein